MLQILRISSQVVTVQQQQQEQFDTMPPGSLVSTSHPAMAPTCSVASSFKYDCTYVNGTMSSSITAAATVI